MTQLRLWANGAYETADVGTFALDSGSLTIDPEVRWDFVDSRDVGTGVLLGYRPGRNDNKPGFASFVSGSEALRGLPDVPGTFDFGAHAYVAVFGLPVFAQVRSALSGSQGALINLGVYAAFSTVADTEITVLPTVSWADARQMQAFYGVGPGVTTARGFPPYVPGSGWQNAAIEISGDWQAVRSWHVVASIAYQRLLGGAAASPIVTAKNQRSGLIGLAWHY